MQVYVGYGFSVDDISNEELVKLVRERDDMLYKDMQAKCEIEEDMAASVVETIEVHASTVADYIRDIINAEESVKAGTDYIVSSYDNFLVFDSARFADDSARTKYIRTQEDFVGMIARYIDVSALTFGNLYDGSDWVDPAYYLE